VSWKGQANLVTWWPKERPKPRFRFPVGRSGPDFTCLWRFSASQRRPHGASRKHPSGKIAVRSAKAWKNEAPGVFQLVEEHRGDAFRAIYTVRFEKAVYVLHCFQKKSPSGVRTARQDVDLVRKRLRTAQEDYEVRYARKRD